MIRVLIKQAGEKARIRQIDDDYKAMQEIVGGHLAHLMLTKDLTMLVDDDGKLKHREPNFVTDFDVILGTVIFAGVDGEDLTDITDEQIQDICLEYGFRLEEA